MKGKNLKPSFIFKWVLGTKEGYDWYKKEKKKYYKDIKKAMIRQLFGEDGDV